MSAFDDRAPLAESRIVALPNLQHFNFSGSAVKCATLLTHLHLPVELWFVMTCWSVDQAASRQLGAALSSSWFSAPFSQATSPVEHPLSKEFPMHHLEIRYQTPGSELVFTGSIAPGDIGNLPHYEIILGFSEPALPADDTISLPILPLRRIESLDLGRLRGSDTGPFCEAISEASPALGKIFTSDSTSELFVDWIRRDPALRSPANDPVPSEVEGETPPAPYFPKLKALAVIAQNFSSGLEIELVDALEARARLGCRLEELCLPSRPDPPPSLSGNGMEKLKGLAGIVELH
ncbi:hypothetical protein CC1G_10754 [Coprinopsis cinerea okayama7|uniref:Uncharacterized protein n=1 Tax=Coprinopsis cinerea (strain Okayama-7 / 130 / ATCC MYA-4618 / FGSC 9003) TaxID=240176 RepID=A8P3B3_COPC7|nr:hypothetical protein CC1G_10754 [Coprinopsis cinerea okayama7\|eukprot:XP_001838512.2 hypothetical protein CC1G_10754 [Coprinopsis cinerea okayama7\